MGHPHTHSHTRGGLFAGVAPMDGLSEVGHPNRCDL